MTARQTSYSACNVECYCRLSFYFDNKQSESKEDFSLSAQAHV